MIKNKHDLRWYTLEEINKWKGVDGWEMYKVSKKGDIWNTRSRRFLNPWLAKNERYPRVVLCNNTKEKGFCVHRLVATAYIPNPENKLCVNHKDGNKHNYTLENLEWVTYRENYDHAILTGLGKNPPKLSNVDIAMIRVLYKHDFTNAQIGKRFGVCASHIGLIAKHKSWKHIPSTTPLQEQSFQSKT